jgi:hypothetical protein
MLDSARRSRGVEDVEVLDVAEVLARALDGGAAPAGQAPADAS